MNLEERIIQEAVKTSSYWGENEPKYTEHLERWFIGLFLCFFTPAVLSPLMAWISWSISKAKYKGKYNKRLKVLKEGLEILTWRFLQMPVVDVICEKLVKHFLNRDDLGEVETLDGRTDYSITYHILDNKIALHEEKYWTSSSESVVGYSLGELTVQAREYRDDIYHPVVVFSELKMGVLPHRIYQLALLNAIKNKFHMHIMQDVKFQKLNQPQVFYREANNEIIQGWSYLGRDEKPNLTITLEYRCRTLQRNQW